MTDIQCPSDHELLPLLSGDTTDVALSSHLAVCPSCRQRLEGLRGEVDDLRLLQTLPFPPSAGPAAAWPAMIGRYLVVGPLSAGGQAEVYRAVHPTLDRELVVKLGHKPLEGRPDVRGLLIAEGKLLASLEHPNLVRVYDLDFHEGRPFLVMEYVRGRDLGQYAQEQRLGPRQAAALVARVARAVEVIHRRGIIHQDIKPQNVLIDQDGQPRLIDFGLARLRHAWDDCPGTPSGGTPSFMAPEQARGETQRVGPASDLFALGGVLYLLLTGKPPFQGDSREGVLEKARRCDFDRDALRRVPRRLRAICLKALAPAPEQRHAGAAALAGELERYVLLPRRAFLAGAAGLVGAALVGGAWVLLRDTRAPADPSPPAVRPSLEVQVIRQGRFLKLGEALPLSTASDRIRIVAKAPAGMDLALYSLSPLGRATRLEAERSPSDTFARLIFPAGGGSVPFDAGRGGTELLLLCAGPPAEVAADLSLLIETELGKLPNLPPDTVVRLDRQETRHGRDGSALGSRRSDPTSDVLHRLDRLRQRLRQRFPVLLGVAFSHRP